MSDRKKITLYFYDTAAREVRGTPVEEWTAENGTLMVRMETSRGLNGVPWGLIKKGDTFFKTKVEAAQNYKVKLFQQLNIVEETELLGFERAALLTKLIIDLESRRDSERTSLRAVQLDYYAVTKQIHRIDEIIDTLELEEDENE